MKFWKLVFKNTINEKSSHHMRSMIFLTIASFCLVFSVFWLAVQLNQINNNFHSIKDLEGRNAILSEIVEVTQEQIDILVNDDTNINKIEELDYRLKMLSTELMNFRIEQDDTSFELLNIKLQEMQEEIDYLRKRLK